MVQRASSSADFFVAGFCSYGAYLIIQRGSCTLIPIDIKDARVEDNTTDCNAAQFRL